MTLPDFRSSIVRLPVESAKHSVFVVDDQPIVHFGIRMLLEDDVDFCFCGGALDVETALRQVELVSPSVTVLDLVLGGRDRLDLLKEVLRLAPSTKVLVYSGLDEALYAPRVFRAGAHGFLSKGVELETVLDAVRALAAGRAYASPSILGAIARERALEDGSGGTLRKLSDRELHVFKLLGAGKRPRGIAEELQLSVKTIHTYCERLKQKTGAETLDELQRHARDDADLG